MLQKPSQIYYQCCYALLNTTNHHGSTCSVANSSNQAWKIFDSLKHAPQTS